MNESDMDDFEDDSQSEEGINELNQEDKMTA